MYQFVYMVLFIFHLANISLCGFVVYTDTRYLTVSPAHPCKVNHSQMINVSHFGPGLPLLFNLH